MRRPDIDRMMASMTAREYKEWEAYERATGPLDSMYEREMLAELHELIQVNNLLTGAAITKKGKKNPAGKFQKVPRAAALHNPIDEDESPDEDEEEYDEEYEEWYQEEEEAKPSGGYDPATDPFANMPQRK
jgi:hypothetical protein